MNPNQTNPSPYQQPQVVYQQKNSNKTVWIVVLVILLVICVVCGICVAINGASFTKGFTEAFNSAMSQYSANSAKSGTVTNELKDLVNELNKSTPQMIDSETRLDGASTYSNILQYNYTLVNYSVSSLDTNKFTTTMRSTLVNYIKSTSALKDFRDEGIQFNYSYKDKDGNSVTFIEIKAEDYK